MQLVKMLLYNPQLILKFRQSPETLQHFPLYPLLLLYYTCTLYLYTVLYTYKGGGAQPPHPQGAALDVDELMELIVESLAGCCLGVGCERVILFLFFPLSD